MGKYFIPLLIEILILLSAGFNTYLAQHSPGSNYFSPSNRLAFGDHLFCQKDYLRAIFEYESLPGAYRKDTVLFKTALSLREIDRCEKALSIFGDLIPRGDLKETARYEYLRTFILNGRFSKFLEEYSLPEYSAPGFADDIDRLAAISELLIGDSPDSSDILGAFGYPDRVIIRDLYMRKIDPPYRDPALAGIMSALIPGSGKIYTGEYGDGITAFLFTGLFAFLAYENFRTDHQFKAWLFTGLGVFFYGGNVYGSVASAQIFNARVRFNFENDIGLFLESKNFYEPDYGFLCR